MNQHNNRMRQILDTLRIQVLSRKNALFSVHK